MPGTWPTIEQPILEAIALEQLGKGRRAFGIAANWAQAKCSGHGSGTENAG
jgi:hypothetical protein